MIAARQIFLGRGGAKLPYDAEVEYLQSSGTQYIDTGIIVNSSTAHTHRMVLDMAMVSTTGWRLNGCSTNGKDAFYIGFSNSQFLYYGNGGDIQTSISSFYDRAIFDLDTVGQRFLVLKGDTAVLDTSIVAGENYSIAGLHIWLFGYGGENMKCSCKIYSCKLYQSGVLVRDFIPVRFTNELGHSEGAMYDRVSGQLFRNQGTGNFSYGADKAS